MKRKSSSKPATARYPISKKPVNNAVVVSDNHFGCQYALCHPTQAKFDSGGKYCPSPAQHKLFAMWEYFWNDWVPMATHGEPYVVIINGDPMDGRHHGSTSQWTQNLADQVKHAQFMLAPIVGAKLCAASYLVRGTEAHAGQASENEELLAKGLGCVPDINGNYARNDLWLRVGKGLVHALHHIGTSGSASYESTAVIKELIAEYSEAGCWHREPPNVVVRSHRHRHLEVRIPTASGYGISFCTAGWQLRTPFVWRIPMGRVSMPQIGGSLIRQGDHDLYTRHQVWSIEREPIVEPMVETPMMTSAPSEKFGDEA